jgi:hypothetical protein
MTGTEWYQNREWDSSRAAEFLKRARRAKHRKLHYFQSQASVLLEEHIPQAALELLNELASDQPLHHRHAATHRLRAQALEALDRIPEASSAFRTALEIERRSKHEKAGVALRFGFFAVQRNLKAFYPEIESAMMEDPPLVVLPDDELMFHAFCAVLPEEKGQGQAAREHAVKALEAASKTHSGWSRHPDAGLVKNVDQAIKATLERLATG